MISGQFPFFTQNFIAHGCIESEKSPQIGSAPTRRVQEVFQSCLDGEIFFRGRLVMLFLVGMNKVGQKLKIIGLVASKLLLKTGHRLGNFEGILMADFVVDRPWEMYLT